MSLEQRQEGERRYLLAGNRLAGPVQMEIRLREADNMAADPPLPYRVVLPPYSSSVAVALRLLDSRQNGSIRYAYGYMPGDPAARPAADFPYRPPIAPGQEYRISQGFFGQHSHQGEQNQYAVDLDMPEHTPVYAARAGVVLAVESGVADSGDATELRFHANYVRILHDDGGMAVYAHLAPGNAVIAPSQPVAAGQLIGYSGSSGYSTGPHLHFAIQRNAGMRLESLPFHFAAPGGARLQPEEGAWLRGLPN